MKSSFGATAAMSAIVLMGIGLPPSPLAAQEWPTRPIRIMVGFGAGGGTDVVTRIIADPLGDVLGQRVIVENKAGAGGTIAGDIVAKGPTDGYNVLMISPGHTVSAVMIKAQNYDAVKDFTPIGMVANSALVIVASKDLPADDVKGLIAIAQKEPGKFNYGTVGIGSTQHLTAELFSQRAGISAQHVSFRTTPEVVTALLRHDVAYGVELAHAVRGQVQSGDLKILAVTTGKRWPTLPNVPTVIEAGIPDFEVSGWYGLVFPAGVPAAIVEKMRAGVAQALGREEVRKQLDNVGAIANLSTPQEFGKLIADEVAKWRAVAKTAKLEPN